MIMRILGIFRNKISVTVMAFIAVALIIWFGAQYIRFGSQQEPLDYLWRVIIILVIWFVWAIVLIFKQQKDKKQNDAMVNDIASANQDSSNTDNERSAEEIKVLGERFSQALEQLKQSKFKAKTGSRSLYELPWYIVIGPPGAGKTTMLVNSGLQFPLADTLGQGALGGIGGTRNCDWWFTDEAVLIDTAGRYTTQDSHRTLDNSAWHGFLNLLKKHRPRQPINGAILAISFEDLMVQSEEQRRQLAETLRARIDELTKHLGIRFPVYIFITKCDLVAGFSEYFATLTQAEREQVWGTTFPFDEQGGIDFSANWGNAFEELLQELNKRTLWRMHNERDVQKRTLIHNFPVQLATLRNATVSLLRDAFSNSKYTRILH